MGSKTRCRSRDRTESTISNWMSLIMGPLTNGYQKPSMEKALTKEVCEAVDFSPYFHIHQVGQVSLSPLALGHFCESTL